jgi:hypothetical protein
MDCLRTYASRLQYRELGRAKVHDRQREPHHTVKSYLRTCWAAQKIRCLYVGKVYGTEGSGQNQSIGYFS